jgi:hypothetical protein
MELLAAFTPTTGRVELQPQSPPGVTPCFRTPDAVPTFRVAAE